MTIAAAPTPAPMVDPVLPTPAPAANRLHRLRSRHLPRKRRLVVIAHRRSREFRCRTAIRILIRSCD